MIFKFLQVLQAETSLPSSAWNTTPCQHRVKSPPASKWLKWQGMTSHSFAHFITRLLNEVFILKKKLEIMKIFINTNEIKLHTRKARKMLEKRLTITNQQPDSRTWQINGKWCKINEMLLKKYSKMNNIEMLWKFKNVMFVLCSKGIIETRWFWTRHTSYEIWNATKSKHFWSKLK